MVHTKLSTVVKAVRLRYAVRSSCCWCRLLDGHPSMDDELGLHCG
jgi:hypothetical protein